MKDCLVCDGELQYSERWDAEFCPVCNSWTENACTDQNPIHDCLKYGCKNFVTRCKDCNRIVNDFLYEIGY